MKKILKRIFIVGIVLFLLMQLYQPARNIDGGQVLPTHFFELYNVPLNIKNTLQTSCFDCHSNNTNYPWYSYLQPVRFLLDKDIKNGKEELNFSEFGNYSKRRQENKLKSVAKRIEKGEMPLANYTLIHKNAILSDTQKVEIIKWINQPPTKIE